MNSREHSEPIEFEKMSRQLRHDHVGKKAAHRFAYNGHLRFVSVPWRF